MTNDREPRHRSLHARTPALARDVARRRSPVAHVAVTDERQQGGRPRTDAEFPVNGIGCVAPGAHVPAAMEPVLVMRGADRDPILARVPAAARAEHDVVIVEIAPGTARRYGATP